jgi:hypothetical protein
MTVGICLCAIFVWAFVRLPEKNTRMPQARFEIMNPALNWPKKGLAKFDSQASVRVGNGSGQARNNFCINSLVCLLVNVCVLLTISCWTSVMKAVLFPRF